MSDDKAKRHAQIGKFSKKDADAMERWDTWLGALGKVLGPVLSQIPPNMGSKTLAT